MKQLSEKHQKELFTLLYDAAVNAGINVIEDKINRKGGVCKLDEKLMVVYDKNSSLYERNRLIINSLRKLDPEKIFLPPKVREIIESQQ